MEDDALTPPAAIVDAAWREGRLVYQATADGRDRVVAAGQIERVIPPSTASVSPVT
jgi:hypothetical protein